MTIDYQSPIAVKVAVAVVVTVAAVPVGNSENAIDGANRATDARADGTADRGTDRTRNAAAFVRSLLGAAHDTLRMPGMADGEKREDQRRARKQARAR